jgi:hypothetical protein
MLRSVGRECLLPYSPGACPSRACPQWVSSRLSSPGIAPHGRACGSWSGRRSHRLDELCDRRQLVLIELMPASWRSALITKVSARLRVGCRTVQIQIPRSR